MSTVSFDVWIVSPSFVDFCVHMCFHLLDVSVLYKIHLALTQHCHGKHLQRLLNQVISGSMIVLWQYVHAYQTLNGCFGLMIGKVDIHLSSLVIDGWASTSTTMGNSHLRRLPHKLFLHTTSNRISTLCFHIQVEVEIHNATPKCYLTHFHSNFHVLFLMDSQWLLPTVPTPGRETLRGAVAA